MILNKTLSQQQQKQQNKTKQKPPNKTNKKPNINALKILRAAHAIQNTQAEWAEPDLLVP